MEVQTVAFWRYPYAEGTNSCIVNRLPTLEVPTLPFFQANVLPLGVRLGRPVRFRVIFYMHFVSTKPTALLTCVTVTSQLAHE